MVSVGNLSQTTHHRHNFLFSFHAITDPSVMSFNMQVEFLVLLLQTAAAFDVI